MTKTPYIKWPVQRLKFVASVMPSNVDKLTDPDHVPVQLCNYVDVYKNDQITGDMEFMPASATPAQIARFALRGGDVLITKDSETPDDIAVPAYVDSSAAGVVCGYHLALLRPIAGRMLGRYLFWAICSRPVSSAFSARAQGITRFGLTVGAMGDVPIPLPPPAKQHAIADFLERETAKIDALIATQERLIALLDEKRQATITHAVTKGLDPNAPMKESGVEWLGKVPANWGVLPLKRCCRIPNGLVDPTVGRYATLSLIAPNHIQSGTGRLLEVETADDQGAISGKYHFAKGTVLYSKIRPALRKACVAPFEGLCSADMYPIYSTKIMPRLMLYQLLSDCFSRFAILASDRVAMPKVNRETIGNFPMVVPPSAEQEVIVRYVDEAVAEIDRLRDRSVEVIERLRERRTALITAAVTGQIDVTHPAITEAAE